MPKVYLEGWQQQCCGRTLAVGQHVDLRLRPLAAPDHLRRYLGDLVDELDGYDERHPPEDNPEATTSVLVLDVQAAYCRFVELTDDADGYTHGPVAGTTYLERRAAPVHHEQDAGDDIEWLGYVVEVT